MDNELATYAGIIEKAEKTLDEQLIDQFSGVLLGSAIADALGWVTEFIKTPDQLRKNYRVDQIRDFLAWNKRTGGRFYTYIDRISQGEYSDDTQLTLCTARSMMPDGSCDMEHFSKKELPSWLDYARGAGIASTAAARAIQRKTAKWNSNFFRIKAADGHLDYHEAGGNGAAMRIAPIALANMRDFERAYIEIWRNSVVTHGHPRAIVGALAYARALHLVLNHQGLSNTEIIADLRHFASGLPVPSEHSGLREWLLSWNRGREKRFEVCFDETKQEMVEYIDFVERREQRPTREVLEHLGCFERATRGSGTATVAAALFIFLRHRGQFERAVIEAVNLLGADTDTVGLMVAGLVGAEVGYMGIPERWTTKLQDFPYFLRVAKALSKIALRKGTGPDLLPQMDDFVREGPNVLEAMRIGKISQGQRVVHPLLGLGWVHSVSSGWVKKRGGGKIILAHVVFDMGQSCWFRLYLAGART